MTDNKEAAQILDACCGGKMWWWDKNHPLAIYMDKREAPKGSMEKITGRSDWNPNWECAPDIIGDFREMPFADESFQLVVFDPPHIVREKQPPEGINGLKYGALHPKTEQDDLRLGFSECWRVLAQGGTLVFKWGAGGIERVQPHFPAVPIVGTRTPRGGQTRWFVFYKPLTTNNDGSPGRFRSDKSGEWPTEQHPAAWSYQSDPSGPQADCEAGSNA